MTNPREKLHRHGTPKQEVFRTEADKGHLVDKLKIILTRARH